MLDFVSRLPLLGFRAAREHESLCALHAETRTLLADPEARPFEAEPSVSGWSPAQHFFHCADINEGVLEWVRARCAGEVEGEAQGALNRNGRIVLLGGRIPRGRAKTPSQFTPPEQPERGALEEMLRQNEALLDALRPCLARLDDLGGRMKHPRMGMLNPREWLRFAHVHTRHHQHIVRDVVERRA